MLKLHKQTNVLRKKLSTSIYDLVLIYVCHFHHHPPVIFLSNNGLSRYSCLYLGSLHPRIFVCRNYNEKKICFWKRVIWIRLHLLFLYHFLWCSFKNCDKSVVCSSDKMQCILDFVGKRIKNSKYGNRANTGFWIVLSVFCSRVMERNLSVHHTCIFNFFLYVVLRE